MIVKAKGFSQDSDVDFEIAPEFPYETALLRAMRGRRVDLLYVEPTSGSPLKLVFRAIVKGARV